MLIFLAFASCNPHHFHDHQPQNSLSKKVTQNTAEMNKTDDSLPYRQIPDAPENYTSGNVIARTVDGLGFRYYWATEGLVGKDLEYKPSEKGRTNFETLEHIHGLSKTILNGALNKPNVRSSDKEQLTFEAMRAQTLNNFKTASDHFRGKTEVDISEMKIIFQRGDKSSEFPFWNMLNGPIADAIWHTGQIVMMRRASGNPLPKGVSVFMGTRKE